MTSLTRSMFALVLFAAACGKLPPATAGLGEPCTRNADCAAPYVCSDATCILDAGRACTPGDKRCNGSAVETCKADGSGYAFDEKCATGCSEGACNPKVCAAGETTCDAGVAFSCLSDGSAWTFDHACPGACDADGKACAPPVCHPYETRCATDDPAKIETCDARGSAFVESACPAPTGGTAVCDQGECRTQICSTVGSGASAVRDGQCDGDVRMACNDLGTAFEPQEQCAFGCVGDGSTATCAPAACAAGDEKCDGTALEECAPDRRSFALVQYCPSGCTGAGTSAACTPPACQPGTRTCAIDPQSGASYVQECQADGLTIQAIASCPQSCIAGSCITDNANCAPGDLRCSGVETQLCVQLADGTTQWDFSQHCLGSCQGGACDAAGACGCASGSTAACGSAANPAVTVNVLGAPPGTALPADNGLSSVLVYTNPITDAAGLPVPDGTLVTFTQSGTDALFGSADADPSKPGLQRPTLRGRARALVRSPAAARDVTISAGVGGSCTGSTLLHFGGAPAGQAWVAEDFSTYRLFDRVNSTGGWDTTVGEASGSPVFSFGTGTDGDLEATSGTTRDLWAEGLAKGWKVVAIGPQSVQTDSVAVGLGAGDEVLLVNAYSQTLNQSNVAPTAGVYELKHVQSVAGGVVTFTEPVEKSYGPGGNGDLTGQHVFVQRVPQFRNLTIDPAATVTALGYANGGSGVLFLRARGTVDVSGALSMNEAGLPPNFIQYGSNTQELSRLLLGSGQQRSGGGVLVVAAKSLVVRGGSPGGSVTASSSTGGFGGDLWLQAGAMTAGANSTVSATGLTTATDGRVRLDFGTGGAITTLPAPFLGQSGPFLVQSLPAYDEPVPASGRQLLIHTVTVAGLIGGEGTTAVGLPADLPGVHLDLSLDGLPFGSADAGIVTSGAGAKELRFRARLETLVDEPTELLGVALKVDAS